MRTKEELQKYGINIDKILKSNYFKDVPVETIYSSLNRTITFLVNKNFSQVDVVKAINANASFITCDTDNLEQSYSYFDEFNYSSEQRIRIITFSPQFLSLSTKTLRSRFTTFISLGYSAQIISIMHHRFPTLLNYPEEEIQNRFKDIVEIGFDHRQVLDMTLKYSPLFGIAKERIKERLSDIEGYGYSEEDAKTMVYHLPCVFGYLKENLDNKIKVCHEIGVNKGLVKKPTNLIQSAELTYARGCYFRENGIIVDDDDFRDLFLDNVKFKSKFGVTKDELLRSYPFDIWLKEKGKIK